MVCGGCGSPNPDSVRFCGHCGLNLADTSLSQTIISTPEGTAAVPALASRTRADTGVITPPPDSSQAMTIATPATDSDSMTMAAPSQAQSAGTLDLQPGASFGSRYQIECLLGEGGMGAVYKVYDSELGREVALKLVKPELAKSAQTMQRFKRELLLASKISHKNILRIHDLGDWNGIKFITMAFVEGCDLAGLIEKNGRLPFDQAVKFAKQLCAALDAAHSEGVVHRDLKPQNILIDQQDNLYVSDFGLAKSLEPEATMMTRVGQIMGTPRYMSPEQVEATDVDHRSDLYSLGLIFYEMFTATLPFRGESTMQLMYQRVSTPPQNPREVCPELPEYIANIILKCLQKDPAKRYQSAREILADFEAQNAPEVAVPTGNRTISIQLGTSYSRWLISGVALALVIALAFAIPRSRHFILRTPAADQAAKPAIRQYMAVLPFRIIGDEQTAKYLADGVVDSISAKLSGLSNVYIAPAAAVTAAAKEQDPQKLARALGVKMLLQGTVTTGGSDKIAITVTLDDQGNQGKNVLHQDFSGVKGDLLTLEDQIFSQVVSSLNIKQSNEEQARTTARPTEKIDAYEFYLKGRSQWREFKSTKDLQAAIGLFENAAKADPNFALAYAGLADAEHRMFNQTKDAEWSQKALGAAQRAEALNDNLPEVHFTLGTIYTDTGRDAEAIAELQRALKLAPNSDEALRRLGTAYMKAGRQQDAIAAYTKATEVNPYLWTNFNRLGNAYFELGENEKALQAWRRVTELEPDRAEGWANIGVDYYRQGKWMDSIPNLQKAISKQPKATYYTNLGVAYFFLTRYDEAVKAFEKAVELQPNDGGFRVNLADAYRWSGQKAKASATYDEAIAIAYKSLRQNPQDTEALRELAISYAKKNDSKQAMEFISRARTIDQKNNWLMYEEATVYSLAGQNDKALASLKVAVQNGYPLEEAKADPELKQLRDTVEFRKLLSDSSLPRKK